MLPHKRLVGVVVALAVLSVYPGTAHATRWAWVKMKCPLCGTIDEFAVVCSYGGYIYSWPSKYQYVYWPMTTEYCVYSCRGCGLSCLMGDFSDIPEKSHDPLSHALEGVSFDGQHEDYSGIPIVDRLAVAEKVYRVLGRGNEFWCRFRRIQGFHLEEAGLLVAATNARRSALDHVAQMLKDRQYDDIRKELLYISGAMKLHLADPSGALADFRAGRRLRYVNSFMLPGDADSTNKYLTDLLTECAVTAGEALDAESGAALPYAVLKALRSGQTAELEKHVIDRWDVDRTKHLWQTVSGLEVYETWALRRARECRETAIDSIAVVRRQANARGIYWQNARVMGVTYNGLGFPYHSRVRTEVLDLYMTVQTGGRIVHLILPSCPMVGGIRKLAGAVRLGE